jgi:hypothetical protein
LEDRKVGHTLFLLTVTCLAGQTAAGTEIITVPQSPQSPRAVLGDPIPADHTPNLWDRMRSWKPFSRNEESTGDHPRLFQRMQTRLTGIFHRNSGPENGGSRPALTPAAAGTPAKTGEPPLVEPGAKTPNLFVAPINFHSAPATARLPLTPEMAKKTGHDVNFSWITGQLRQEHGKWIIHYSNPEVVDSFGGRLTLDASASQMSTFRDGDLVSVQGRAGNGVYHATTVTLLEHETN